MLRSQRLIVCGLVSIAFIAVRQVSPVLSAGSGAPGDPSEPAAPPVALAPPGPELVASKLAAARQHIPPSFLRAPSGKAAIPLESLGGSGISDTAEGIVDVPESLTSPAQGHQVVYGTIFPVGDVDQYTFVGNAGDRVQLRMWRTSGGLDAFLSLYDSQGQLVAYNDDISLGVDTNSLVGVVLPSTDVYIIVAAAYCCNRDPYYFTGGYGLSVDILPDPCGRTGVTNGVIVYEGPGYSGRSTLVTAGWTTLPSGFSLPRSVRFQGAYRVGWVADFWSEVCVSNSWCDFDLMGRASADSPNLGLNPSQSSAYYYVDIHQ